MVHGIALLVTAWFVRAHLQARCKAPGQPKEVLEMEPEAIPGQLEWGEVLVSMRAAPINPADLDTIQTGGVFGQDQAKLPFVAGHDGIGVVAKVRARAARCGCI